MQCRCECHRFALRVKVVLRSAAENEIRAWLETNGPALASGEWIHADTAGSRLSFALAAPDADDRYMVGWMPSVSLRVEIRGWTKSAAVAFARQKLQGLLQQNDGAAISATPRLDRRSVFDKGELARGANAHGIELDSILE